jgi:molybdenum cofactor sulfurtransferase
MSDHSAAPRSQRVSHPGGWRDPQGGASPTRQQQQPRSRRTGRGGRRAPCRPELPKAEAAFLRRYPGYSGTSILDDLRASEYARLDRQGHVYLDYAGGGLYAQRQLCAHFAELAAGVLGNPHSNSRTSQATTEAVERTRARVLEYFHASPREYLAIFTANASAALKLVGEAYPFGPKAGYLLTVDNHNSVNGIREFAKARGAAVRYAPLQTPELRIDCDRLRDELAPTETHARGLFAYPAQSNFSGVQHPLELIGAAQAAGWDVLLDAAAFAPTNRLDLSRWKPDCVALSFYKMFGYPTGVGCLLLRRRMLAKLHRPWFAGGTVEIASVQRSNYVPAGDAAAYEDGTVNYLSIPAVELGLRHISRIGIDVIHERVRCLTGWLLDNLRELKHTNGRPLVCVHGPLRMETRGATVAFNLLSVDGDRFDIHRVEELANEARISLRTGCFCNPGVAEVVHGLTAAQLAEPFDVGRGMRGSASRSQIRTLPSKAIGAVRVSLGLATNFADVLQLLQFVRSFLDSG